MGLGGFFKGLGKVALKAAPIAAAFIPGVGPLASAAIGGATSAASKKLSGGSWKDALLAGGIGAGTSYGLDKVAGIGNVKGIGPSKDIAGVASKVAGKGGGFTAGLGEFAKGAIGQGGKGWQGALGGMLGSNAPNIIGGAFNRNQEPSLSNNVGLPPYMMNLNGSNDPRLARDMFRGLGPTMGSTNQNNPNLAMSLGQGRLEAIQNQPFRKGYEINYLGSDDETPFKTQMPAIGTYGSRRNRRRNEEADKGREE